MKNIHNGCRFFCQPKRRPACGRPLGIIPRSKEKILSGMSTPPEDFRGIDLCSLSFTARVEVSVILYVSDLELLESRNTDHNCRDTWLMD